MGTIKTYGASDNLGGANSIQADEGGNARGIGAVDLQVSRTAATQVASGANSFAMGVDNTASGIGSAAVGGTQNTAGPNTFNGVFAGQLNTASGHRTACAGGYGNSATSDWAATLGGHSNLASNNYAVCVGGNSHVASGSGSGCFGGEDNDTTGQYSVMLGGSACDVTGKWSAGIGGNVNIVGGFRNVIAGGNNNSCGSSSNASGILGGSTNTIYTTADYCAIVGGSYGFVSSQNGVVLGGFRNNVPADYAGAMGIGAKADLPATFALSANSAGTGAGIVGEAQLQLVHLHVDHAAASSANMSAAGTEIVVANDQYLSLKGKVFAINETNSPRMTTWDVDIEVFENAAALTFLQGSGVIAINNQTAGEAAITLTIEASGTTLRFRITQPDTDTRRYGAALVVNRLEFAT